MITVCGGYGERVERASEVLPGLRRTVKVVQEEEQAVLNMIYKHPGSGVMPFMEKNATVNQENRQGGPVIDNILKS